VGSRAGYMVFPLHNSFPLLARKVPATCVAYWTVGTDRLRDHCCPRPRMDKAWS
jgi:hypothetical protein